MAKLIYSSIASVDGYVADEHGNFDWAAPDDEVHAFVNELERPVGTYLYGRRMYDVMVAWETMPTEDQPAVIRDYAEIWRAADKIVYSTTLDNAVKRQDADRALVRPRGRATAEDRARRVTSPSVVRVSRRTRSRRDSSTNATCSSRPSSSAGARASSPKASGSTWSSWRNAVSATERCTCSTERRARRARPGSGRRRA